MTGKIGWGIHLTILLGRRWPGGDGLCFDSTTMCLTWSIEVVLLGVRCPCGVIHSMAPLSSHGCLHVAGSIVAFKYLAYAHTILVGLILRKESKRRDLHPSGRQLLECHEQWGLWNTPVGNPGQTTSVASTATCPVCRDPYEKWEARRWGKRPQVPTQATRNVVVCAQVGKEFPDTSKNERRIKLEWERPLEQWAGSRESQTLFAGL